MADTYRAHTQLRQGVEDRPTTSGVAEYLKQRNEAQDETNIWNAENVSEVYFSALEKNRDRMREILGILNEGTEANEPLSEGLLSEDLRERYIALVAFGTDMFEKGLSLGATDKDAMSEPTDDEVFPDPWSQDARTEIQ